MRYDEKLTAASLLTVVLFTAQALACGMDPLTMHVIDAASPDESRSQKGIEGLRKRGYEGLNAILSNYRHAIVNKTKPADWEQTRKVIDAVAKQRDAHASRLFWHTDMEAARLVAKDENKPMLSLRLLGNLDDEFSCANSRFFRTVLYANAEVSSALRERHVLHWESVRPVPRITIDFGDGRTLNRTITGNSIHYILDSNGKPIDALPGLYGPKAFLKGLERAQGVIRAMAEAPKKKREDVLKRYHLT